jgi:hypothetical protein
MTCGKSWLLPGTPASSTNKTDRHDITEILLKVVLNTIKPNQPTLILRSGKHQHEPMIYHGPGKYANHYITDVV